MDDVFGWIVINIKSTTGTRADNAGGIPLLLYATTNVEMDLTRKYQGRNVASQFSKAISAGHFNDNAFRDYFFLVWNKNNGKVIVNSVLGLKKITWNVNNLPFQIKWKDNQEFQEKESKAFIQEMKQGYQSKDIWQVKILESLSNLSI